MVNKKGVEPDTTLVAEARWLSLPKPVLTIAAAPFDGLRERLVGKKRF